VRGLTANRQTASAVLRCHRFVQNLCCGHHELRADSTRWMRPQAETAARRRPNPGGWGIGRERQVRKARILHDLASMAACYEFLAASSRPVIGNPGTNGINPSSKACT
jgi:hypothetical protein